MIDTIPTPIFCGPTAGGKSELALRVARAFKARGIKTAILAADAFQVYQGLDIASAKPTRQECAEIDHLLIDLVPVSERFNSSDWLENAERAIENCRKQNILPIVVGGTHLYVKLLVDGMFEGPAANEQLRAELRALGSTALREELQRIDPAAATRIHPNDERRTIRAIEVFRMTGKTITEHQGQWDSGTPAFQGGRTELGTSAFQAERSSKWLDLAQLSSRLNSEKPLRPKGFIPRDPFPEGIKGEISDLSVSRRFLPHLTLPDATYFVTWKTLNDHHLSSQERSLVLDALTHFDDEQCRVYAACVMSNHVHWIVKPHHAVELLDLVSRVKRFSARKINEARGTSGSVWVPECFDHIIRDVAYFNELVRYVFENPVAARAASAGHTYQWTLVHADVLGDLLGLESRGTQGCCSESRGTQFHLFLLDWPNELINRRINARVKQMMERGMLEETRSLREHLGPTAREALGTKQLLAHLDGKYSLDEAVERIKIETRRFAKNQRTWLKRLRVTPPSRATVSVLAAGETLSPTGLPEPPMNEWVDQVMDTLSKYKQQSKSA
ncbi:MAG: tRNA (adenosine(37)-N6)-dimethylallyltransferase MiaA [Phycisphaerales bacterium]